MFNKIVAFVNRLINPPKVIIRIDRGNAIRLKGVISRRCLMDCTDFFTKNNIESGSIYIRDGEYGDKIEFSSDFPEKYQQRLRNIVSSY